MLDIHTVVPFRVIRAAAPHLREPAKEEREEGVEVFRKIVNVSSISGTMGNAGQAQLLRGQVGRGRPHQDAGQGVGPVQDQRQRGRVRLDRDAAHGVEGGRRTRWRSTAQKVQLGIPDQMRGMASMLIPLGRTGTPEEAAGGVFFLCSPWSNFVHGQVLNITGGQFTGMTT